MRTSLSSRKKKKTVMSAWSCGTTLGGGPKASQRPPSQNAGKRKATELAGSGDSTEPVNRHPAFCAGSAPLPAFSPATDEIAAFGSRQLGPPEGGVTYAAVLVGPAAPTQPSGSLKPTAMDSDMSEPAAHLREPTRACLVTCPGL